MFQHDLVGEGETGRGVAGSVDVWNGYHSFYSTLESLDSCLNPFHNAIDHV